MRHIRQTLENPFMGMASLESISEDSIYILELPKHVFVGKHCDLPSHVNYSQCTHDGVPIVRGRLLGGAFVFEGEQRNMYVVQFSTEPVPEDVFTNRIIAGLNSLGVPAALHANDFVVGDKQVGMYAPSEKTEHGHFLLAQLTLQTDFDCLEQLLRFPHSKWLDKPVDNIREWITPLSNFGVDADKLVSALGGVNATLSQAELLEASERTSFFESEEWTKYGEYRK